MKYLVKTDNSGTLEEVDYTRVIWDTTKANMLIQNIIGGGGVSSDYVDLGLPSGLLWAKKNLGAETEKDAGLYFQWGDTQGYTAEQVGVDKTFDWNTYKFSIDDSGSNFSKYNKTDNKTVLDLEDDAVHVMLGGNWRMPTSEDFVELINNTDLYLVPESGEEIKGTVNENAFKWQQSTSLTHKGIKFYNKNDYSSYLFIPAVGRASANSVKDSGLYCFIWASSIYEEYHSNKAMDLYSSAVYAAIAGGISYNTRLVGLPIRGVCSK